MIGGSRRGKYCTQCSENVEEKKNILLKLEAGRVGSTEITRDANVSADNESKCDQNLKFIS